VIFEERDIALRPSQPLTPNQGVVEFVQQGGTKGRPVASRDGLSVEERIIMSAKSFGEFLKQKRIATGQTLRAFCAAHGFDVGNFSKLERGVLAPPHGDDRLGAYAEALGLDRESSEWFEFFDLAAAARGEIPSDLLSDAKVVDRLPVMFQAMRDMDPAKLDRFIDLVRRS
jgi:transcriptional regulator with XRE-family HTH domain